jgi:hypothetical protein
MIGIHIDPRRLLGLLHLSPFGFAMAGLCVPGSAVWFQHVSYPSPEGPSDVGTMLNRQERLADEMGGRQKHGAITCRSKGLSTSRTGAS